MAIHDYAELAAGVLDDGDILDGIMDGTDRAMPDIPRGDTRTVPDGVRDLAFRLWVFEAARNPRRVVELLRERTGLTISVHAVRQWASVDDWAGNAGRLHQAFSFAAQPTIRAGIDHAAIEAVDTLRNVMRNDKSPASQVKAAGLVLGIAGYVPVPTMAGSVSVMVNTGRDALSQASDDDLANLINAYQADDPGTHTPAPEPTDIEYRVASQADRVRASVRSQLSPR